MKRRRNIFERRYEEQLDEVKAKKPEPIVLSREGTTRELVPSEILFDSFTFLSRSCLETQISCVNRRFNQVVYGPMRNAPPYLVYDEIIFSNENCAQPSDGKTAGPTVFVTDSNVQNPLKVDIFTSDYNVIPQYVRFRCLTTKLFANELMDRQLFDRLKIFYNKLRHTIGQNQDIMIRNIASNKTAHVLESLNEIGTVPPPRLISIEFEKNDLQREARTSNENIFSSTLIQKCSNLRFIGTGNFFTVHELIHYFHNRTCCALTYYGENSILDIKELMIAFLHAFNTDNEIRRYHFEWRINDMLPSRVVIQDFYRQRLLKTKVITSETFAIYFGFDQYRDYRVLVERAVIPSSSV